jgi:hypothetical protein
MRKIDPLLEAQMLQAMAEHKAREVQRVAQQGLGNPVVSTDFNGYRVVAVGNRVMYSRTWRTFHDFLLHYIKVMLGAEWGNAEIAKPLDQRHPIMVWYNEMCHMQRRAGMGDGEIKQGAMTGGVSAYLRLAYDLYCIAHNAKVQETLIARLKDAKQFPGAHYETYVAATFARAGFGIEFEDESVRDSTHCEFVATHPSGRKYSVEAKRRHHAGDDPLSKLRVGVQLVGALRKKAAHSRIVFIDMNIAKPMDKASAGNLLTMAAAQVRKFERTQHKANPFEPAYVLVTNVPIPRDVEGEPPPMCAVESSYRIGDYGFGTFFPSLRAAHRSRQKHLDVELLFESLEKYQTIPSTFDGDNPALAFLKDQPPRLRIGQAYEIPLEDGRPARGILVDALMLEREKRVWGTYKTDSGGHVTCTTPVTDAEVAAYRLHPETFFGVEKRVSKGLGSKLDAFYFFLEGFKATPKEQLLKAMAGYANFQELQALTQQDLAEIRAEHMVAGMPADAFPEHPWARRRP